MKRVIIVLGLLAIIATSTCIGAITRTAPELATVAVDYAARPPSATEIITQQRDRVTDDTAANGWLVPLLLLAMVGILVFIGVMFWREKSAEYLKQRRLATRQQRRQRPLPLHQPSLLQEVPRTPPSHQLPAGQEE